MKKILVVATFLAIYTNPIISKFKPLPNSRLGLRCYKVDQKLSTKSDIHARLAYCTDKHGNPIARPQLFDIRNEQTILFGPGNMHESLDSGGSVRVAEISNHGMRISCTKGYHADISPKGHISCISHQAHKPNKP